MTNFSDPANVSHLVGLWDFRSGHETKDTGLADGIAQNGHFENGAYASGDQLRTDGYNDIFEVSGADHPFDLAEGTVEVQFTQSHHIGTSPDTIVNRGEYADRSSEGFFEIRVTIDGKVEVFHQMSNGDGGATLTLSTDKNFFNPGDVVNATYSWDETAGAIFTVENLTKGTTTELTSDVTGLTLDIGDNDDENFTFGARESDDGDYDRFFKGAIDYVAVYDMDIQATGSDEIVEGTSGADVIDLAYTGDPDGDMIDANDNAAGTNDDVVDAGAGDDTVKAGDGNDTVFAGSGDDSVQGEAGDDVIFGDQSLGLADETSGSVRESFEWDKAPDLNGGGLVNGDPIGNFTQNTGSVDVEFTIGPSSKGVFHGFESTNQNVAGIDSGSETIDPKSSFYSEAGGNGKMATYTMEFKEPGTDTLSSVENVSFRINDIDGDGIVRVQAYDADGNMVEIELTAGSKLTMSDTDGVAGNDTADSKGGYADDDSPDYSILVSIPGPVAKIVVQHGQDGHDNSGVQITDVFFDVPVAVDDDGPGDDTLEGGAGDDLIYGETGNDLIDGGAGNDTLYGDDAPDGTTIGPNLIVNGSFEDTSGLASTGYGYVGTGAIPAWTEANGSEIDVHNDGRGGLDATDGNNWLDLEASPGNNKVGQDVAGIVDGKTYKLTFDAGDSSGAVGSGPNENLVKVYWGGELIATLDPAQGDFTSYEFEVVGGAGDGSDRLEFQGTGVQDNIGASIDNVKLYLLAGSTGPAGNDTIFGGIGDDVIYGQGGDDQLFGNDGNDLIDGGDGNDSMGGGTGNDTMSGGAGNDTMTGGSGDDVMDGGAGDDMITGSSGNDAITDLDGANTINAGITGTPDRGFPNPFGPPNVVNPDTNAFDDRDTVITGMGDDSITTGDDNDIITSAGGNNTIDAGYDDDSITTGDGDDLITSGEGSDTVYSGGGNDTIYGGLGPTEPDAFNVINYDLDGNQVDPILDNGKDYIDAGDGDDLVYGQDDDDTIYGGAGNDTLDGGIDNDLIFGGAGNDSIIGGQGADTMDGGFGNDTFTIGLYTDPLSGDVHAEGAGDIIVGGEDADDGDNDVLDLSGAGPLKIIYDDAIDPTGTSGESGKVIFYKDAAQTEIAGELTFKEIENVIPCFTPGSLIATPKGEVPVESLSVGDKVITRDNGIQEIRWVGQRTLNRDELARAPNLKPILIKAGSLGYGLPERDMVVSPQHRVLVSGDRTQLYFNESEVLVAAKHLVNAGAIQTLDTLRTTYIHFMFDRHEVVLSDGAWTESFQPGDQTLGAMGAEERNEIVTLFPDLATEEGISDYTSARRALKAHEAKLLQL